MCSSMNTNEFQYPGGTEAESRAHLLAGCNQHGEQNFLLVRFAEVRDVATQVNRDYKENGTMTFLLTQYRTESDCFQRGFLSSCIRTTAEWSSVVFERFEFFRVLLHVLIKFFIHLCVQICSETIPVRNARWHHAPRQRCGTSLTIRQLHLWRQRNVQKTVMRTRMTCLCIFFCFGV